MPALSFVTVEVDKKTLDEVKNMLSTVRNGVATALKRAADQTAATAREEIVRTTQSRLHLPYTRIKQNTGVFKARFGSTTAWAVIYRRQIPMVDFPHLFSPIIGTSVSIRKENGPEIRRHSFKATMKSGHVGIFERGIGKLGDSNAGEEPAGRLHIDEQYGPSIGNVFHYNDEAEVMRRMAAVFSLRLLARAEYLLSRA